MCRRQSPGFSLSILLGLLLCSASTRAQDIPKQQSQDDVLRVYTDLVQSDVMVLDKQGRLVKDLTREEFDLRVDGKQRPIEFFEQITAGSINEEAQLAAARGIQSTTKAPPVDLDRGRTILFYIDDLHLTAGDLVFLRRTLLAFIDNELGQNDELVITSASGQIGFLQQLTDNRAVLHAAVNRLRAIPYSIRDPGQPPMTEYQALLIDNRPAAMSSAAMTIHDVFDFFVQQEMQQTNSPYEQAELMVRSRARNPSAGREHYAEHGYRPSVFGWLIERTVRA